LGLWRATPGSNGQLASKQSIMAQSKKIQTKVTVTKPLSRHCYRIHYLMIGKRLAGNHKQENFLPPTAWSSSNQDKRTVLNLDAFPLVVYLLSGFSTVNGILYAQYRNANLNLTIAHSGSVFNVLSCFWNCCCDLGTRLLNLLPF
jgi:hypothetical protein